MERFTGSASQWDSLVAGFPEAHLLQSWEWANVKKDVGWEPMPYVWEGEDSRTQPSALAMILKRRIAMGGFSARLSILYCPKGPILDWANLSLRVSVLNDLQSFSKKQGAIFLKMDPDIIPGRGAHEIGTSYEEPGEAAIGDELARRGWKYSSDQIQFKNTVWIDLTKTEEQLLSDMKQKTRYNVKLAEKKGVTVRVGTQTDLPMLYKMYAETSLRDGFVIRDESYYKSVWESFIALAHEVKNGSAQLIPWAEPLIAEVDHTPVAALILFYFARRAYFLYGMSSDLHREKMPNYLLQWTAIQRARQAGCKVYDLWGAPDEFIESDVLWNVFRFKEGLGGQVILTPGAWDYAPNPLWYRMYSQVIPRLLDVMRLRGKARTKKSVTERLA